MDVDTPENVCVFSPYHNTRFINIVKYMIKSNQCMLQDLALSVAGAILIALVIDVIFIKLVFRYKDGVSTVLHYFIQVVVIVSTRNYLCRLGTLWFCYKYVENILT